MATLKISTRLLMGFSVLLLLLLALTLIAVNRMGVVDRNLQQIVEVDARKLQLAIGLRDLLRDQSLAIRDVVMQDDMSFKKSELKRMKDVAAQYAKIRSELQTGFSEAQTQQALQNFVPLETALKTALDAVIEHSLNQDVPAAGEAIRSQYRPAQLALVNALNQLIATIESGSAQSAQTASNTYRNAVLALWGLGSVAVLAGVLVGVLTIRTIVPPLRAAVVAAERMASADLTDQRLPATEDEVGQLMVAMTHVARELSTSMAHVHEAASAIRLASTEIASGTMDLSMRTEDTATNLLKTSQSVENLTLVVQQSALAAGSANRLALDASGVAQRGGDVVAEVVSTMQEINSSSNKINDIIGVIDGIAFQTNILALNAAVEAARAGEQGRGFAVVATEVRQLAQRSAQAAREIKALIQASVSKAAAGSELADRAGASMHDIVNSVHRVTDVITQITTASSQQTVEIQEINNAIHALDQMTQQNAALVEQSAAAAEHLKDQAERLSQIVSVFKFEKTELPTKLTYSA
jgi:methyl-accepting chemotaxis protein